MSRLLSRKNDAGTGVMDQMIVGDYFTHHYEEHILEMRSALKRKCDVLGSALRESFGPSVEFYVPRGGMYLWVKLPEGVDSRRLAGPALREGIAFNPGPRLVGGPGRRSRGTCASALPFPTRTKFGKGLKNWQTYSAGRALSPEAGRSPSAPGPSETAPAPPASSGISAQSRGRNAPKGFSLESAAFLVLRYP